MVQEKRQRGGQKGNRNALKHGYYSRVFTKEEKTDYCKAGDVQGIDEEIALIRHVIKTVANRSDEKSLSILVRATNVLNRLLRTRNKLYGQQDRLGEAMQNIVRDILVPMGVNIGHDFFSHDTPVNAATKNEDEADLP